MGDDDRVCNVDDDDMPREASTIMNKLWSDERIRTAINDKPERH